LVVAAVRWSTSASLVACPGWSQCFQECEQAVGRLIAAAAGAEQPGQPNESAREISDDADGNHDAFPDEGVRADDPGHRGRLAFTSCLEDDGQGLVALVSPVRQPDSRGRFGTPAIRPTHQGSLRRGISFARESENKVPMKGRRDGPSHERLWHRSGNSAVLSYQSGPVIRAHGRRAGGRPHRASASSNSFGRTHLDVRCTEAIWLSTSARPGLRGQWSPVHHAAQARQPLRRCGSSAPPDAASDQRGATGRRVGSAPERLGTTCYQRASTRLLPLPSRASPRPRPRR
jgi:hypothetical protein